MNHVLEVDNLYVDYLTATGRFSAIRGVSLNVGKGEILGLVGESGCGKSTLGRSLLRLNDGHSTEYRGAIRLDGEDVLGLPDKQLPKIRGNEIAMIFQDPLRSLNPVFTIGTQLKSALRLGGLKDKRAIQDEAVSLLERVGLDEPLRRLGQHPHELSGGQRQRVVIAIALAQKPKVLVADEPTTALDVTTQKQILELLKGLCVDMGMSMIFVTHDLAVVWQLCDKVAVMYFGIVVEQGTTREVFDHPVHPYTKGLLASVPSMVIPKDKPLATIERQGATTAGDLRWDDETVRFVTVEGMHVARDITSPRQEEPCQL